MYFTSTFKGLQMTIILIYFLMKLHHRTLRK